LLVFQLGQPAFLWRWRATVCFRSIRENSSEVSNAAHHHHLDRCFVGGVAAVVDIGSLADLTNIGTLFAFILVCIGVVILRRTESSRPRPFRVPMVPLFPILGVIFCFVLMLSLPLETWIRFFVWLGIGLLIYFFYGVGHSKLRRGEDAGITEDQPPPIVKT